MADPDRMVFRTAPRHPDFRCNGVLGPQAPDLNGKFERSGRTDKDKLSQLFTGNPDTSFLLTYDGRVGYDEPSGVVIMTLVDGASLALLVLSACKTAVDSNRARLGLPGVQFERAHAANSAVSGRTRMRQGCELVIDLYRRIHPSCISKAEALRKAETTLRSSEQFEHPFCWASIHVGQ